MATALVRHWLAADKRVLAVDADHNMDLSYNLGGSPALFLGSEPYAVKRYAGVEDSHPFGEAREKLRAENRTFRLLPPDPFTSRFTTLLSPSLLMMAAGPHTDIVRSGEHCSHSLAAPLKVYLPLLELTADERVVIDERAGTDPVATGILKGVDLAVVVQEPTVNSRRVAGQIQRELELAGVAHFVVDNKVSDAETDTNNAIQKIEERLKQ